MSNVTIIHLVRRENSPAVFYSFLDAYNAHDAGIEHDVLLAMKGYGDIPAPRPGLLPKARVTMYPDTSYDIGTYRRAAEDVKTDYVCFLNSFSRPLVDGWLGDMLHAILAPHAGIVGCTGSWEGIPGSPFPNPHIRTNAFLMRRELFLDCVPAGDLTREQCLQLEAGPESITRQVRECALDPVVVGARGFTHLDTAHMTNIFRIGDQQDLLVADNRTDDYQNADKARREWLQRLAWGTTET